MTRPLAILDLFCGACGGWSLGMHRAGFETVAACEIDPWRRAIFQTNNPKAVMYDDVTKLRASDIVRDVGHLPDVVVGSPPCQDASSANTKGKGLSGARTGLFFDAIRLVGEIRPRWCAFENVPGIRTRGVDRIYGELEALGYACGTFVVGADHVGANHGRKRIWIVGHDPGQVGTPTDRPWLATADADQARSPHGQVEPGARAAQEPGAGRRAGSLPDAAEGGAGCGHDAEMGRGPGHGGPPAGPWPDWNGGLASHLRLDDGLSARLAPAPGAAARNARRDPRAGEIVAAFGDAVVPEIPYRIARSILNVERALAALSPI